MLRAAIADPDPVLFLEHKRTYRLINGEVPDEPFTVPIGPADVKREGSDLTAVAYGLMLHHCLEAAQRLQDEHGVSVEVVDVRTISPLDKETILASVRKTGKAIVVYEDNRTYGAGAEIVATIAEEAMFDLDGADRADRRPRRPRDGLRDQPRAHLHAGRGPGLRPHARARAEPDPAPVRPRSLSVSGCAEDVDNPSTVNPHDATPGPDRERSTSRHDLTVLGAVALFTIGVATGAFQVIHESLEARARGLADAAFGVLIVGCWAAGVIALLRIGAMRGTNSTGAPRPRRSTRPSSSRCLPLPIRGTRRTSPAPCPPPTSVPQIERLLGFTAQQWMEDPELWGRLVHVEDLDASCSRHGERRSTARERFIVEYRIRHRDG